MNAGVRGWAAVFVVHAALAGAVRAQSFRTGQEYADWVAFYYEHPQPARLAAAFEYFVASPDFFNPDTRARTSYFFAAASASDPAQLDALVAAAGRSRTPTARAFALRTIWLCRCAASRRLIEEAARTWADSGLAQVAAILLAEDPPDLLSSPPASPRDLEFLWAGFYATGARAWVERIAAALPGVDSTAGAARVLGQAARAGLITHAVLHGRVMDIVRELQGAGQRDQARQLAVVLRYADRIRHAECTVEDPCTPPSN